MFVQVIKGRTSDAEGVRRQGDVWREQVRPGAIGFLGGVWGVAADGTFVAVARFEDEASAQANADRPEQTAWYEDTAKYFEGDVSFRESSDVRLLFEGGSDDAGFVQVMEGRVSDRARAEALETPEMMEGLRAARPDLIGGLHIWFPDDSFVDVAYFTSEEEARKGESSSEFSESEGNAEWAEVYGEMTYVDLQNPQLIS